MCCVLTLIPDAAVKINDLEPPYLAIIADVNSDVGYLDVTVTSPPSSKPVQSLQESSKSRHCLPGSTSLSCLTAWQVSFGPGKHREACLMQSSRQTAAGNKEAAGVHELQKITMNTSAPVPQAMHEVHTYIPPAHL